LFFVDPTSSEQLKQLSLLVPLYNKYYNAVNFLMIIKNDGALNEQALTKFKNDYPWESTALASTHSIFSSYHLMVSTKQLIRHFSRFKKQSTVITIDKSYGTFQLSKNECIFVQKTKHAL
jgi:hypothetical protein